MAKRKDSQKKVDENKVELAKTVAEQSKKIAKSYATIESTILKAFRWFSGWFDKLLFNQRYASVVTLLMAKVPSPLGVMVHSPPLDGNEVETLKLL